MNLEYNKKLKIALDGTKTTVQKAVAALDRMTLTNSEGRDRLLIQRVMDENDLRASILYNGNIVWPRGRLLKEYQKYSKSGSIENLTDFFYSFLNLGCDDIAHYNKQGYIEYYNGDFEEVKKKVIFATVFVPAWHTDLQKVFGTFREWDDSKKDKKPRRHNVKVAKTDGEDDWFDSIDPTALREELVWRGIVNGEIVDEKALSESSFVKQVMRDVAAISRQEAEKNKFEQLSLFDRTA